MGGPVRNLNLFDDYQKYVKRLSIHELEDILSHLDKDKYPERYRLVAEELANKLKTTKQDREERPVRWMTQAELKKAYRDIDKIKYPERALDLRDELERRKAYDAAVPSNSKERKERHVGWMSKAELRREYRRIDKTKDSARAADIHDELERRKNQGFVGRLKGNGTGITSIVPPDKTPVDQPPAENLPLVFHGSAREYFRIWIVNLCLTLLTLGIFSAWAKVRKKRYFYSHTTLDGTPFEYLGKPIPILKGRIVAVFGFGAWYIASNFMTSLLPYVIGAGLIAAPWVLVRSAAFNARYSAFRNMTFHMGGTYLDALKVLYAYGIVPLFAIAIMFQGFNNPFFIGAVTFVFTVSLPFLFCRIRKFIVEFTSYGGIRGQFTATGGQYFKIYFLAGVITIAVVFPLVLLINVLFISPQLKWLMTYVMAVQGYIGYVIGFAYIRARSINLVWNHTRIGPVQFYSSIRFRGLLSLYVTNLLGIIVSAGFLIPWAVIRTMRYRVDHMEADRLGSLTGFSGTEKHSVAAVGAETLDIFDWDLAL